MNETNSGWTAEHVRDQLAWSPLLELWTIPLYLAAAYSIDLSDVFGDKQPTIAPLPDKGPVDADGLPIAPYNAYTARDLKQACFNVIMSVALQEMFHLELASNVCNAVGASVNFSGDNAPKYTGSPADVVPKGLKPPTGPVGAWVTKVLSGKAHSGGGSLIQPLSADLIELFKWVEHEASDSTDYQPSYPSIGTFYDALKAGIDEILGSNPTQLYPPPYYTGNADPTAADLRQKNAFQTWLSSEREYKFSTQISGNVDLAVGLINQAVEAIVEQGEGGHGSVTVNPQFVPQTTEYELETELDQLTHFERFDKLKEIWAAAAEKSGGSATYPVKQPPTSLTQQFNIILEQAFSSFLDSITSDFNSPNTDLGLWAMSGVGGRIFNVWQQGGVPSFAYQDYKSWLKKQQAAGIILHACQGLNECKGMGIAGTGARAGEGDCAVAWLHTCGGTNKCSQQGGCGYAVKPGKVPPDAQKPYVADNPENWIPSANACNGLGGCGVPIPAGLNNQYDDDVPGQRFNKQDAYPVPPSTDGTLGPNKLVWEHARALFVARMNAKGIAFGTPENLPNKLRKNLTPTSNSSKPKT